MEREYDRERKRESWRDGTAHCPVPLFLSESCCFILHSYLFTALKFQGKGHETSDLHDLMQAYRHWGQRMYPKVKSCRKMNMHIAYQQTNIVLDI